MAIIQKIRDKYAKVAGGVIVLALVGFVLMDATSGGQSNGLFGNSTSIAKVDGTKIDYQEYEAAIQAREEQMKAQNAGTMDEGTTAQLRDQVYGQLVMTKILESITNKLGITVSETEFKDMFNPENPDPMVRQAFTNGQGQFLADQIAPTIAQMQKAKDPQSKARWADFKNQLIANKVQDKLNTIIEGAYYTPKFVLDDINDARNNLANISYVNLPYTLISDDKVPVSDEEVNKYIADHKVQFTNKEASRTIDYISFDIAPSVEDSNRVRTELESLKEKLSHTSDEDMESFVKINSRIQMPPTYVSEENINQMPNAAEIKAAAPGTIVGPFAYGQDLAMVKVLDRASLPDTVKARHILVMTKDRQGQQIRTEEQAQARIDSIIALEKSGVAFDSLLVKFSDDYDANNPKFFYEIPLEQRAGYTKPFGDFLFSGAAAGASKVVKVDQGYSGLHYINILSKSAKNVNSTKLALIAKPISIDKSTYDIVYNKASEFAFKVIGPKSVNFEKEATTLGYNIQTAPGLNNNSQVVQGLGGSAELVKWAYKAKVGDVSSTITLGSKVIIAKLTQINEPGLLKPEGTQKLGIQNLVRNQKKAKLLIEANKGKDLATIASSNQVQVATADSITFNSPNIAGLGNELNVLGYAFNKSFKDNTVSPGLPGLGSVVYMTVNNRTKMPEQGRNIEIERKMAEAMIKGQFSKMVIEGIYQSADIKDTRAKVYNR